MGNYTGLEMPVLNEIAQAEAKNADPIRRAAQIWALVPAALADNHGALNGATQTLGEGWQDNTFDAAFKGPVEEGLASIKNSAQTVTQAKPQEILGILAGQIDHTAQRVAELHKEWLELKELLAKTAGQPGMGALAAVIEKRMEQLRLQAVAQVNAEGQAYAAATRSVQSAGQGHNWNGPAASSPPSPSSDSDALAAARPFQTVTSLQPDAGQAGTSQADQLRQAQLDAARAAENAADSAAGNTAGNTAGSDTGLAGGVATAPAPSTIPAASTPPAAPATTGTAPGTVPLTGTAPIGRFGGYGTSVPMTAASRSGGPIPKAARVTGGITPAGSGQAPVLPETTTARSTGSRGSVGVPMGAVPPLSPLALGKLQDLIGRLKPVVTPHGSARDVESRRVAGVPDTLRGRTGRAEADEYALSAGQRNRRSRKEQDDAPETVELLDEELWRVEQTRTQTGSVRTAG